MASAYSRKTDFGLVIVISVANGFDLNGMSPPQTELENGTIIPISRTGRDKIDSQTTPQGNQSTVNPKRLKKQAAFPSRLAKYLQ